jgi:hypothetical protein
MGWYETGEIPVALVRRWSWLHLTRLNAKAA